jgi:hypothetical protein
MMEKLCRGLKGKNWRWKDQCRNLKAMAMFAVSCRKDVIDVVTQLGSCPKLYILSPREAVRDGRRMIPMAGHVWLEKSHAVLEGV